MAADELHVTPAAISQQIRALEGYCGNELFHRLTRALGLTDVGEAALPAIRDGFDKLAEGAEVMRAKSGGAVVTVSVAPSFGAKWLVPRLDRFRAQYPDYDVRIDATDALANFSGDGVDIALRYGRGAYRNLRADRLMTEVTFPVCSPDLLTRDPPLRRPGDLRHQTLLHVEWKKEQESAPNWRMWLRAAGINDIDAERGPRFSVESMAVEAAIAGQGVALVSGALVEGDLRAKRLVRPFPQSVSEATAFCYYVVYPEAKASTPKVMAFRDWVMGEAVRPVGIDGAVEASSHLG